MHLSSLASVLLSLALIAPSAASAAVLPRSPRSSLDGSAALQAALRKRQARSADIVRRIRDGPNRKRADPSAPVCAAGGVGTNVLVNGNFEAATSASQSPPWVLTPPVNGIDFKYEGLDGYGGTPGTRSIGVSFRMFSPSQDSVKGVAGHLEQGNIKVCSGVPYQITYDLGRGGDNLPYNCNVALFITGDGLSTPLSVYSGSPCTAAADCPNSNGNGVSYGTFTTSLGTFSSTTAAGSIKVVYEVSCPNAVPDQGQSTKLYGLDNVVVARSA